MARIETARGTRIDRRTFLLANLALATGVSAQGPQFETFAQWLAVSQRIRDDALQPCVDRIRSLDGDIQAWLQVLPQKPTGNGALRGIPFGVKDIIEIRGLATEYGSPIRVRGGWSGDVYGVAPHSGRRDSEPPRAAEPSLRLSEDLKVHRLRTGKG